MTNLKVLLLGFVILFSLGSFGLKITAQEALPEIMEAVNLDENIQPEDLDISEPRILPDSPFYFFKGIVRGIRSLFTFDPVAKAELKLKFANEKLMEAKILAKKKPEFFPKALENYKAETDQLKEIAIKIKETVDDPKVDKFLDKFVDHNLKHQKLFGRFEKELPPEFYEKIEKIKEENLTKFSDVGLKLALPEIFKEKIITVMEATPGSQFKHFKNLEVLQLVEEKVPKPAKPAIRLAMENTLKRLRENLETMSPEDREKFKGYIENIGGNETRHLAIIDEFEREEVPEVIREELEKAKERILKRIEKRLKEYEKRQLKIARKEFLDHLTKHGRWEDLRIIKKLENNLSPEIIDQILEIKRKAEEKLIETIKKAETPEQEREFFEKIEKKFHDLQQLEVLKEIEDVIPPEKKELFEKMKERTLERMKEEVKKAKKMAKEKREMIFDKLVGDSPEQIKILKEIDLPSEVMLEIMKETAETLMHRIELTEDPERLEFFKKKIEDEEEIRKRLKKNKPEIFKKLKEKSKVLLEMISPEKVREQIEKAEKTIDLAESIFAKLDPELQKEIQEKSPYPALIKTAKKHLENAKEAFEKENYGKAFGQATAALHHGSNLLRILDKITIRKTTEKERLEKFKKVFEKIGEKIADLPEITKVIPPPEKITKCPVPTIPPPKSCVGKWEVRKNRYGCPFFVCVGKMKELSCAKAGEKVNRNPLMGPTNRQCCEGLHEIRISRSYSICELRPPEKMECKTDWDCPQPLCPRAKAKCVEGKCIVPRCKIPWERPKIEKQPLKPEKVKVKRIEIEAEIKKEKKEIEVEKKKKEKEIIHPDTEDKFKTYVYWYCKQVGGKILNTYSCKTERKVYSPVELKEKWIEAEKMAEKICKERGGIKLSMLECKLSTGEIYKIPVEKVIK